MTVNEPSLPTDPVPIPKRPRIDAGWDDEPAETTSSEPSVRRGNPFGGASRPVVMAGILGDVVFIDGTTWSPHASLYTAAGWASGVVLLFSIACVAWFPSGGVIVAALGVGLAIIALFSRHPLVAGVLLAAQAAVFVMCCRAVIG